MTTIQTAFWIVPEECAHLGVGCTHSLELLMASDQAFDDLIWIKGK